MNILLSIVFVCKDLSSFNDAQFLVDTVVITKSESFDFGIPNLF